MNVQARGVTAPELLVIAIIGVCLYVLLDTCTGIVGALYGGMGPCVMDFAEQVMGDIVRLINVIGYVFR